MTSSTSSLPFVPRPWGGLASFVDLHREMNRAFDNLFFNGGTLLASPFALAPGATSLPEVQDDEKGVLVRVDMPGIQAADLDVRLEGDMLTVSGEREKTATPGRDAEGQATVRIESAVRLPFVPDPEEVRADLKDGVLTVQVPRDGRSERSRRIQVIAASEGNGSPSNDARGSAASSTQDIESAGESREAAESAARARFDADAQEEMSAHAESA
jgi:HSP20 family protein